MDWETFETRAWLRRIEHRHRLRRKQRRVDRLWNLAGVTLLCAVSFLIVWGVMS